MIGTAVFASVDETAWTVLITGFMCIHGAPAAH